VSETIESIDDSAKPQPPRPPLAINLVIAAVCAEVLFMLIRVASMFGYTSQLNALLAKSNHDAKHPKVPYGPVEIAHDLHKVRTSGLWQGLVVGIALLLLAYSLRKVATASVTRWALLIIMIMTGGPFSVIPAHGLPVVPQVALVLSGIASIVAIVLLFLPDSREYFRAMSRARSGAAAGAGAPARPGLGALFRPRAPVERKPQPTAGLRSSAASRAQARAAKSKTRNDAEAIARGADLARNRAKASKSRRTEF
jgi:hypothetical protein